jgi:hypothetical protein
MLKLLRASRTCVITGLMMMWAARVDAQSVTLAWDPNTETDLAGYIVGYGYGPSRDDTVVDVGLATTWTINGFLPGVSYYFRVYAYNNLGVRSFPSDEVWTTIDGGPSQTSCQGAAPVAGWLCVNGGWLPPDSPVVVEYVESPPAPTPSTSAPQSSCEGTAPVAGWLCINGGWIPPDSPHAAGYTGSTTSAPVSSLGTQSPAPQPPASAGCPGVAPVAGWLCINGGWLPPDSPHAAAYFASTTPAPSPSAGGTATPGTSSSSTVAPAPAIVTSGPVASCPGTAPVAGWLCISGNWIPPDSPLAAGYSGSPSASPAAPTPAPATSTGTTTGSAPPPGSCAGPAPAAGWVCVGSGWVPADHPLARGGGEL